MISRHIVIPGAPQGKERPHVTRRGHAFTPEKTKEYERHVRDCYEARYPLSEPLRGPVKAFIRATYPVPTQKGKRRLKKQEKLDRYANRIHPTEKPDLDNVAKAVCDALNGLAYEDDAQIYVLEITKNYVSHEEDECKVVVTLMAEEEETRP